MINKEFNLNVNHYVSIVTVNYNGLKDTLLLLESLKQYNTYPSEIIVVDNGSKVNEAKKIKETYPEIICIRSDKNLGFAGGNNLGIKIAKGDAIFFINNDAEILDDGIHKMIDSLFSNDEIGALSPKIKFFHPPQNIQFAGYTKMSKVTMRNFLIGFEQQDQEKYNNRKETYFLHGAAMIVKKKVIDLIGGMPEIYFLYYEELDWCQKIRNAGYKLIYEPGFTVYHKESQSTGQNSPFKTYYLVRNRLLYAFRNIKGGNKYISILYQMLIASPVHFIKFSIKGNFKNAYSIIKGTISFFVMNKY